jgi:hypothetical protein
MHVWFGASYVVAWHNLYCCSLARWLHSGSLDYIRRTLLCHSCGLLTRKVRCFKSSWCGRCCAAHLSTTKAVFSGTTLQWCSSARASKRYNVTVSNIKFWYSMHKVTLQHGHCSMNVAACSWLY